MKIWERIFVNNHILCIVYEYGNDIVLGVGGESSKSLKRSQKHKT